MSPQPRTRAQAHEHPHPTPGRDRRGEYDVVVVGGGHAGVEAALAAGRLGARAALCTYDGSKIGEMSCNPAIGGLGKGQLAREVDALGGIMGRVIDATGIQFRMLNTAKGNAVQAPRAQADRHRYREDVTRRVHAADGVDVIVGGVASLILGADRHVRGVVLEDGRRITALAVVLTTGTFLRAVMHTGEERASGGRVGEGSCDGLSRDLARLELPLGRLKTGTPPRLDAGSIDWGQLQEQHGDERPTPFSFATDEAAFPRLPQIACHVTYTNPRSHEIIRANIHRAPMYAGRIDGIGPRYCPSVEDKVMRFADRERHQIYLEPEGLDTEVVYVNGISTSLPAEVQEEFVHAIEGLERARFLRHGYAVEYDFVQPSALDPTLAVESTPGLYLAGQINGTSGYEEAAAQGLVAGANAALWGRDRAPLVLGRHEAYVGVLVDDLVVTNPTEPYRMFTSRAEYRLLLRQDDADRRLTRNAHALGLVDDDALARLDAREARIDGVVALLRATRWPRDPSRTLADALRRPEVKLGELLASVPALAAVDLTRDQLLTAQADVKYEGYVQRQELEVARTRRQETTRIPSDIDYTRLAGLRLEAREKLQSLRPATLGAAARIAGINPPDVALVALEVARTESGQNPPPPRRRILS